jgi:replication factor C large subunit
MSSHTRTTPWTIKYRPESAKEIQGQNKPVQQVVDFIQNYKSQKAKGLVIYGGTGSGKTQSVYAIANDLDRELIEINASDFRNTEHIKAVVGGALEQRSLFMKEKLILIDEIDNVSGRYDKGAIPTINKLLDSSPFPVVCTAQDIYDKKFKALRKKTTQVQFSTLSYLSVAKFLRHILENEGIEYDPDAVKSLARHADGDLRAAINDLQILTIGKERLEKEDVESLTERNREESILQALLKIFKTKDFEISRQALDNVDEDLDKVILWLEHNIPYEYEKPHERHKAYAALSDASLFQGRIMRWQYWRFLAYVAILSSVGVSLAKDEKYKKYTPYKPTDRILKMWQANIKNAQKNDILEKLSHILHAPGKVLDDSQIITLFQIIYKHDPELFESIAEKCELTDTNIEWIKSTLEKKTK